MSSTQSDMNIALTSKRINMTLDEIIKESNNDKKNFRTNKAGKKVFNKPNGGKRINNNNNNNKTQVTASPKVKKTLNLTSPKKTTHTNKLVSPDKIKIQIQNNKAINKPQRPVVATGFARTKLRTIGQQNRIVRPTNGVRSHNNNNNNTRSVSVNNNNNNNRPARVVQRYEKPITLNDRFSRK